MSETKIAAIPTHVKASVDKSGRERPAHIAVRHKKITFRENVGHEDDAAEVAANPVSAFIAKHGGAEHLRESLDAMTSDQRAKLIDAMAHLGACTTADVMKKLGIHEPEVTETKSDIDELTTKIRARLEAAKIEGVLSSEDHDKLIAILETEGYAATVAAVAGLRPRETIEEVPAAPEVHVIEADRAALDATRRLAADNAVLQDKADSLYQRHVEATNKAVRAAFEIDKRKARKWKVPAQMMENEAEHRKNAAQYLADWRAFCADNGLANAETEEVTPL